MTLLYSQIDLHRPAHRARRPESGSSVHARPVDAPSSIGQISFTLTNAHVTGALAVSDVCMISMRSEVIHGGRRFNLTRFLQTKQEYSEGVWVIESDEVEILGYGLSQIEAEQSFSAQFAATWDSIAGEDDEILTQDAQELKRLFLSIVSEVVE